MRVVVQVSLQGSFRFSRQMFSGVWIGRQCWWRKTKRLNEGRCVGFVWVSVQMWMRASAPAISLRMCSFVSAPSLHSSLFGLEHLKQQSEWGRMLVHAHLPHGSEIFSHYRTRHQTLFKKCISSSLRLNATVSDSVDLLTSPLQRVYAANRCEISASNFPQEAGGCQTALVCSSSVGLCVLTGRRSDVSLSQSHTKDVMRFHVPGASDSSVHSSVWL